MSESAGDFVVEYFIPVVLFKVMFVAGRNVPQARSSCLDFPEILPRPYNIVIDPNLFRRNCMSHPCNGLVIFIDRSPLSRWEEMDMVRFIQKNTVWLDNTFYKLVRLPIRFASMEKMVDLCGGTRDVPA